MDKYQIITVLVSRALVGFSYTTLYAIRYITDLRTFFVAEIVFVKKLA